MEENEFSDSGGEDWDELEEERASMTKAFAVLRSGEEGDSREEVECAEPEGRLQIRNLPLYFGAQLTYGESMVLIMAFILSHHLTSSAVVNLLTLIGLHTQYDSIFCTSKYLFDKFFNIQNLAFPVQRHHFCQACLDSVLPDDILCKTCGSNLKSNKSTFYFLEMNIVSQLQALFKREDFYRAVLKQKQRKKAPGAIEDIHDGLVYRNIPELEDPRNISFLMNTDGIKVFRSSNYGLWPVYLAINELPFRMRTRRENMVFAGLWFGETKPIMRLFLQPLAQSIQKLQEGFEVNPPGMEEFQCKAYLVACTCDLQAKAMVMDMVAHNGYYGCPKCLQKGTHQRMRHQFPCDEEDSNGPLRTHQATMEHAKEAYGQQSRVYGIKGPSWLSVIEGFDVIAGHSIDYMHGALLGVVKTLMNLWFKSDRAICKNHLHEIDTILQNIKPPQDIHRTPRGIADHMQHWKASEFRAWLLYYSVPIMQLFLPTEHFDNYVLLVSAVHMLLGSTITEEDIRTADDNLRQFVEGFQALYGPELVSLNIHSLRHYAQTVRELGPLWAHSCFFFEDVNGQVLRLIHGTQAVEEQVLRAVAILQKFTEVQDHFKPGTDAKKLYDRLRSVVQSPEDRSNFTEIGGSCFAVGSLTEQKRNANGLFGRLAKSHLDAVVAALDFPPESMMTYQRMMKEGEMVHSRQYSRPVRHNSYTICYMYNGVKCYGEVLYFLQALGRGCGCVTRNCLCGTIICRHLAVVQCYDLLTPTPGDIDNANAVHTVPHIHRCAPTQTYRAVKLNEIVAKVVNMCVKEHVYVASFPNHVEKE